MSGDLFATVANTQLKWTRRKGGALCGRAPDSGPGTCSFWWEGCPKAAARNCFVAWTKEVNGIAREGGFEKIILTQDGAEVVLKGSA